MCLYMGLCVSVRVVGAVLYLEVGVYGGIGKCPSESTWFVSCT